MIHGRKYFNNDVLYLRKKHYCPQCKALLKTVKVSKIVNSQSPEAKDFDFSCGDGFLTGDVKFTWKELECPTCNRHLTVREMKQLEGIAPVDKEKAKKIGFVAFLICAIVFFALLIVKQYWF